MRERKNEKRKTQGKENAVFFMKCNISFTLQLFHLQLLLADDCLAWHRLCPVEGLAELLLDGAVLTDKTTEENEFLFAFLAFEELTSAMNYYVPIFSNNWLSKHQNGTVTS